MNNFMAIVNGYLIHPKTICTGSYDVGSEYDPWRKFGYTIPLTFKGMSYFRSITTGRRHQTLQASGEACVCAIDASGDLHIRTIANFYGGSAVKENHRIINLNRVKRIGVSETNAGQACIDAILALKLGHKQTLEMFERILSSDCEYRITRLKPIIERCKKDSLLFSVEDPAEWSNRAKYQTGKMPNLYNGEL